MKHASGLIDPSRAKALVKAALELSQSAGACSFGPPVTHVYNPLEYARESHLVYLRKYGASRKRAIFLGMNPGPFGMAQTGIPFGEIASVRDWLKIEARIEKPPREHPKRLVEGFACQRSEVSGRRLWGLFAERFPRAEDFFAGHFVVNYCPLAFLAESGGNLTPDKLRACDVAALFAACDRHLRRIVEVLEPEWLIGIGEFAEKRARATLEGKTIRIGRILHPSPASPAANQDWPGKATAQLVELGVWPGSCKVGKQ
jgi:single-strand selective monofunctional uracil DNA glycosylase